MYIFATVCMLTVFVIAYCLNLYEDKIERCVTFNNVEVIGKIDEDLIGIVFGEDLAVCNDVLEGYE